MHPGDRPAHLSRKTTMSAVSKVRATKIRQQHSATKLTKPGKAVNGPNLVGQHEGSAKKAARKTAARKSA
jgi:hypothetical protein